MRAVALLSGLAALSTASGPGAQPATAKAPAVRTSAPVTTLLKAHKVVWSLTARYARGRRLPASRPITGGPTVLPVLGHRTTKDGIGWLKVRVPGRPNGRAGWIARRGTRQGTTAWRIVVSTRKRRARVYRRGHLVRNFRAVVGKPSTPTPRGPFFVEESVRMAPGAPGAPYALALSARSDVLQEFEGGPGQIAIHGVANLGGTPGTPVSHGCVRLANPNIAWLAGRIAPGTPVTIR
jgi:lipoprotein-anchoring transpeptidase ErfK/SrfK